MKTILLILSLFICLTAKSQTIEEEYKDYKPAPETITTNTVAPSSTPNVYSNEQTQVVPRQNANPVMKEVKEETKRTARTIGRICLLAVSTLIISSVAIQTNAITIQ
jgi:hypothetical protein